MPLLLLQSLANRIYFGAIRQKSRQNLSPFVAVFVFPDDNIRQLTESGGIVADVFCVVRCGEIDANFPINVSWAIMVVLEHQPV